MLDEDSLHQLILPLSHALPTYIAHIEFSSLEMRQKEKDGLSSLTSGWSDKEKEKEN